MPISEVLTDQAAGLRQMGQRAPTRVVCIASGKGGVGKSHVTVNLALALAREQKRVMVLDADLGLANIDVILGLHPTHNLSHVINGQCDLKDVILTGPEGIRVIPASSGIEKMASLGNAEHAGLISAFSTLGDDLDILLIDSAAGISDSVMTFSRAAHDVIVVLCDELTALADAYALIKLLNRRYQIERFHIVANRIPRKQDGRALFEKLMKVTDRFLDVNLRYLGEVPEDPHLVKALKQQRAVMDAFPNSPSCLAFRRLAAHMERWPLPSSASGYLQFFLEQMISTASQEKALVQ